MLLSFYNDFSLSEVSFILCLGFPPLSLYNLKYMMQLIVLSCFLHSLHSISRVSSSSSFLPPEIPLSFSFPWVTFQMTCTCIKHQIHRKRGKGPLMQRHTTWTTRKRSTFDSFVDKWCAMQREERTKKDVGGIFWSSLIPVSSFVWNERRRSRKVGPKYTLLSCADSTVLSPLKKESRNGEQEKK